MVSSKRSLRSGTKPGGLLLSELGAYLLSPDKAPAGTKRLSNLLRNNKWTHSLIDQFLWQRACERLKEIETNHEQGAGALG